MPTSSVIERRYSVSVNDVLETDHKKPLLNSSSDIGIKSSETLHSATGTDKQVSHVIKQHRVPYTFSDGDVPTVACLPVTYDSNSTVVSEQSSVFNNSSEDIGLCLLQAIESAKAQLHRIEVSSQLRLGAPDGTLTVDPDSLFPVTLVAPHSTQAMHATAFMDQGCNTSCISQALYNRLVAHGAALPTDAITLRDRMTVGLAVGKQPVRDAVVSTAILLHMCAEGACNSAGAQFEHVFVIVPHLVHDVFVGRDLMSRFRYSVQSSYGTSLYQFGSYITAPTVSKPDTETLDINLVTVNHSEPASWVLVSDIDQRVHSIKHTWILSRVVDATGSAVTMEHLHNADCITEITHAALEPTTRVHGISTMYIPLKAVNVDCELKQGDVLGSVSLLAHVDADLQLQQPTKPRALDLYCGVGGFTCGVTEQFDVKLAIDVSPVATGIYCNNNKDVHVITGDIHDDYIRSGLVRQATEQAVSVVFGSPPSLLGNAATASHLQQTVQHYSAMIRIAAAVPTARLLLLESLPALLTTSVVLRPVLELAFICGFQHRVIHVKGDDCGLASRRERVFIVMVRTLADGDSSDVTAVDAALTRLHDMSACERAQRGYVSVRDALAAASLPCDPERSLYGLSSRNNSDGFIHDMDKPAPTIRHHMYTTEVSLPTACEVTAVDAAATATDDVQYLQWDELKAVSSFDRSYSWAMPHGKVASRKHATMLAAATPPAMARYVAELLQRSGVQSVAESQSAMETIGTSKGDESGVDVSLMSLDAQSPSPVSMSATDNTAEIREALREKLLPSMTRARLLSARAAMLAASAVLLATDVSAMYWDTVTAADSTSSRDAPMAVTAATTGPDVGEWPDKSLNMTQQDAQALLARFNNSQLVAAVSSCIGIGKFYGQAFAGTGLSTDTKTTIANFASDDAEIAEVLVQMKAAMPEHMLQIGVDLRGWSATQITRLSFMLLHYQEVFSKNKWDVGHCTALPFRIALREGTTPVTDKPYRYSPKLNELVKIEIDRLLAAGIIRTSMSEWASPVVAVLKKDGTARITVNYRKLNAATIVPKMPLPNIEDLLNSLGGSQVFTVMDITSGYFTSSIHEDAVPLTAMVTAYGLYEWLRCPQGAAGSPGHFTRLMAHVLQGLERVRPFIDDIISHSSSIPQHLHDLDSLFARLLQHCIKLAPAKVHIGCQSVKFLGHVVEVVGIRPDPDKVSTLLAMPEPKDLSALRSWLGLANYYRRFVRDMAKIVSPLTALTAKNVTFSIGARERAAIQQVNTALALHTLMNYPDFNAATDGDRPFILSTDASLEGFGCVLSQADTCGIEQPIAFASRATLQHEKGWSVTDLEAGAIVFGVKKFRHILWGCPFTILSDHRALAYLESCRDKTARLARWYEFLSSFQYEIRYKEGAKHCNADGVSRNPLPATHADKEAEERDELLEAYMMSFESNDQVVAAASDHVQLLYTSVTQALDPAGAADAQTESDYDWSVLASSRELGLMSAKDWRDAQRADDTLQQIITYCEHKTLPIDSGEAATVKRTSSKCYMQTVGSTQLLVRSEASNGVLGGAACIQLVVPTALRDQVLNCLHGSVWSGHQGVRRTLAAVRRHVWWPTWEADTIYWCEHCWPCQARKRSGKISVWPQVFRELPRGAFDTLAIDIFGPLPQSAAGHTHILVVQDMYSRWVQSYALTPEQNTAIGIAEVLIDQYFTSHGVARVLLSDRGAQFMAALSTAVYKVMGIRKLYSTAYHPQTNGMVERFMQSLAQMLAMAVDAAHSDWHLWLSHVSFAYNNSKHASTGVTPFLLATGREPRIALHQILADLAIERSSDVASNIQELVQQLVTRQRLAQSVVDKKHELKRRHVLAKNVQLQEAFGLRHEFKAGEKVWVYRKPITHEAVAADGARMVYRDVVKGLMQKPMKVRLSRKFLDHWHGPYTVIAVGPTVHDGAMIQSNVLYINQHDVPTRVTVHMCKRCRDPTSTTDRPAGLPSGFARFLLTHHPIASPPPTSLTADDVTYETDRHGVEAVLDHRVVTATRGKRSELQYRVRWEGDDICDTWEPMHLLDACAEAIHEYWMQLDRSGTAIRDSQTRVVKGKLAQARAHLANAYAVVRCSIADYTLPRGMQVLPECPIDAALCSIAVQGLRVMQVYSFDEHLPSHFTRWCEGVIRKHPVAIKGKGGIARLAHIQFYEDNKRYRVDLNPKHYNTSADAPPQSWFILGNAAELTPLLSH